ncbi:MAG: nucleotidyltransferase domain-containing protein [Clostridiales bacterium]|nr:nucleotidyltransferase domain-containing protein [Clostridiales bacterium]MDR2713550.1 nucleotidyltransferase domain-containing protein [Clostridiales bacterium]
MMLTLDDIRQVIMPLAEKYDIIKVDLFGSYASGKATETSDADFLVKFRADIPSIFKVLGFKEELETNLRYPVDVVTLPITKKDKLNIDKVIKVYERA